MTVPMFPIVLDLTSVPMFVVGGGEGAAARVADLVGHGAAPVVWFDPTSRSAAGAIQAVTRLPVSEDFETYLPRLVFIGDDLIDQAMPIAAMARAAGAFVHVHDHKASCDFHLPARLRRGRLLLTVSTDGAVAGLSRLLRDHLADHVIDTDWAARVEELAARRADWKVSGVRAGELFKAIAHFVRACGWLPPPRSA
ncbi:MAG: hypothetical protein FJX59_12195 [Alphaproteobacteria bacterium]|nr:hypothetical protein [Alphaproteobacteria bacterium]